MYLASAYSESAESEEVQLLLNDRGRQLRRRTKINSIPTYGVYNRNDYFARCHYKCWKQNGKNGEYLNRLLCFGGESSKTGDCLSTFVFVLMFILPCFALAAVCARKKYEGQEKWEESLIFICFIAQIILVFWHFYALFIIINNHKKWKSSWFVFKVHQKVLSPFTYGSGPSIGERFFDVRKHMKYYDVNAETVLNFPILRMEQRRSLAKKLRNPRGPHCVRIILYTDKFIKTVYRFPRNLTIALLVLSLASLATISYTIYAFFYEN